LLQFARQQQVIDSIVQPQRAGVDLREAFAPRTIQGAQSRLPAGAPLDIENVLDAFNIGAEAAQDCRHRARGGLHLRQRRRDQRIGRQLAGDGGIASAEHKGDQNLAHG